MELVRFPPRAVERGGEFLLRRGAGSDGNIAVLAEDPRQPGVAPHLEIVVRAVHVQLALDQVPVVVDHHHDGRAAVADQRRDLLRRHLQRAVAGQHHRPLVRPRHRHAQRRGRAVADRRVVGLHDEVLRLLDQEIRHRAEGVAGLGQQHHLVVEKTIQAFVEPRRGQFASGSGDERRARRPRLGRMRLQVGPRLQRRDQRAHEIPELHVLENPVADPHPAVGRGNRPLAVEMGAEQPRVQVRQPHAQRQQAIRLLHLPAHGFAAPAALVDADELRMELRQQALAAEHRGERNLHRLDEAQRIGSEPLPRQLHPDQREGVRRAPEPRGRLGHGGGQLRRIGNRGGGWPVRAGRAAGPAGHVGGQFEVARQLPGEAGGEHAVDLGGSGFRIGQEGRAGGDLAVDVELQLVVVHQMVHPRPRLAPPRRRRPGHDDQRHLLGKGSRDGVQDAQPAHAVGHHRAAQPSHAGIAVGRIAGVQLVAGSHPADRAGHDFVEEIQHVVARHPEQMVHPRLLQPVQNVARNRVFLRHGGLLFGRGAFPRPRHGSVYHDPARCPSAPPSRLLFPPPAC